VNASQDTKVGPSVVAETLRSLSEQAKVCHERIDLAEAGQSFNRADVLAEVGRLLDACQNLRDVNQSILRITVLGAGIIATYQDLTIGRRVFSEQGYFSVPTSLGSDHKRKALAKHKDVKKICRSAFAQSDIGECGCPCRDFLD